jgi:hypothetical protein
MRKTVLGIVVALIMALAAVPLISGQLAYADVYSDLGLSTSSEDLENYDQRAESQPYNSKNVSVNPVSETYITEIGTMEVAVDPGQPPQSVGAVKRSLIGDNNLAQTVTETVADENDNKYVKSVALDLNDVGKPHAVAELYYREANNGELYLSIVDPIDDLAGPASNQILVFSNSEAGTPLITDYRNQHSFLTLVAGDFDNDGVSEIVVYVPDADDPRLALYQIVDGVIQDEPEQTFSLPGFSEFVYMTSGDITGDNLADLIVSYNGPGTEQVYSEYTGHIYIFKSQNFSLASPHVFNHLSRGEDNGKDYYTSRINNAAAAIGNVQGDSDDGQMELVVAGSRVNTNGQREVSRVVLGYRYDGAVGRWDFQEVYGRMDLGSAELFNVLNINENKLTTLACVDLLGKDPLTTKGAYTYIDGIIIDELDDVYEGEGGMYTGPNYADYGIVSGNFDGNSYQFEQLKILREKLNWNSASQSWDSGGFEIATYGSPSSVTELDSSTTCAALAAPNTDDDTVIIRYTGHDLQYSFPTVLAALASPPYFGDLEHLDGGESYIGGSTTEITSGEGGGSETHGNVSVKAGAYASLESEVSIFGFKIAQAEYETEFSAGYTWDTSHETEVTTAISYGTFGGQDSVAVYAIPMDVFMYEVWCPGVGGKGGYWTTMNQCFPYEAAYVVIPADRYDEIASREPGLPRIGGELFKHTLGRPETYHSSSLGMFKVKDPIEYELFSTVGFGNAYITQNIEITETDTDSHTFSAELSGRVGGGAVGATAGVTYSIGGGGGWAETTIKNVGYTATLLNMPLEAEDHGYNYAWKLVAYPYISEKQSFPVVTYAVSQVRRPPLLPQNLEMQSSTENSVTLRWDNVDPHVSGYQLYRYYDFEGDLAGYYKIGDEIPVGTTTYTDTGLQPYTNYRYKIQSIGAGYGSQVTESVLGPECVARTNPTSDAPIITQQPESVEVAAGSRAVFQVIAQPAPSASVSDRIFYQWQRYVDGKWQSVEGAGNNLLAINGVSKADAGRYRCAVSQYVKDKPITIYSQAVTLTVNKNNLAVLLSLDPSDGYGDINTPLTVTATLDNIDASIPPTGKINFLLTFYPDPEVTEGEEGAQIEYPDPVLTIIEAAVANGNGAEISWSPNFYGSYDIVAVYLGDGNYHKSTSPTSSFTCVDSSAAAASGLRITGIENNTLTYGDVVNLSATAWQNGSMKTLLVDEVEFVSSDAEGLAVVKSEGSNPKWQLTAARAGTYQLDATATLGATVLKVTKSITVNKAQIAVKVKDQMLNQGDPLEPFALELTSGEMKLEDSLDTVFTVEYLYTVNSSSPAGVYDVFIGNITQAGNNYEVLSVSKGAVNIEGPKYNIRFHGISNGSVLAEVNNWRVLDEDYNSGYDIAAGAHVRFSAVPDAGYRVEKWVVNGIELMKDQAYDTSAYITFNSLSTVLQIEVYFVPDMCDLTYSAGDNGVLTARIGSLNVGSGAVLPAQTVVNFLAAPDDGFMVDQWKVNNSVVNDYKQNSYFHTITQDTDLKVTFTPAEYVAVGYAATGDGQVTAEVTGGSALESGDLVTKGSEVVFTATPDDANTMIKEWIVNGQVVQGSSPVYTAANIQEALDVEVVFIDAITYQVNFGAIGHGADALTAEVDGEPILSGDRVRGYADVLFTAYPPDGYRVKQWKLGSAVIMDDSGESPLLSETYILEDLQSSVTVTVEFESTNSYWVDYWVIDTLPDEEGGENGTINALATYAGVSEPYSSGEDILQDSQVVFTAVPEAGYTVKEWTIDGSAIAGADPVYSIAAIQANHEITVEFEAGINPLTFAAIGQGSVSASSADGEILSGTEVADGTEVTFTAIPDEGYQVKEWRRNGEQLAGGNDTYELTVSNGGFVEVEFEREYYILTLGENLTASVAGAELDDDLVQGDKTVTVTASPPAGYLLTAWYADGVLLEDQTGESYSFTMVQDTEVTADFEQQYYNVIFVAEGNGTITATADSADITSDSDQSGGATLIFTAQPAEGYRVQSWFRGLFEVSGQPESGSDIQTYIIDGLDKPEYIRVFFELKPEDPELQLYVVYFGAGSGGSLSATAEGAPISSGDTVTEGSRVVFSADPDSGKTVDEWSGIDNGTLSNDKLTFTIDSLASGEDVYVTFKNRTTGGGGGGGGGSSPAPAARVETDTGAAFVSPSAGGEISLGSEVSLNIPDGALQGSARVNVEISQAGSLPQEPGGFIFLGQAFEVTVGGHSSYTFNKPVSLTFSFDPGQVPAGSTPVVYFYDRSTSTWIELGGTVAGNTITVTVDHFTVFAVMAKEAAPVQPQPSSPVFSDISRHWAQETIETLAGQGIAQGYGDGAFRPEQSITRAEFAALLVKALQLQNAGDGRVFADTATHWSRDIVAIAESHGIVGGYDENHFGPDDSITREQMAVMAVKAAKLDQGPAQAAFTDSNTISSWAKGSVSAAVQNGIMNGYPDSSFRPQGNTTRAEAMTVIWNLIN